MINRLEQAVKDWAAFREGFNGLGLGIKLQEVRAVHLQHDALQLKTLEEVRQALSYKVVEGHGWLMLTDELVHLPTLQPLDRATPLQGEWHAEGSSWQLRYLGAEDGWRLHQYIVSEPGEKTKATHLAEPISHLRADGKGSLRYSRLWAIENDLNDEPAPAPVLSVLVGYGKEE